MHFEWTEYFVIYKLNFGLFLIGEKVRNHHKYPLSYWRQMQENKRQIPEKNAFHLIEGVLNLFSLELV